MRQDPDVWPAGEDERSGRRQSVSVCRLRGAFYKHVSAGIPVGAQNLTKMMSQMADVVLHEIVERRRLIGRDGLPRDLMEVVP